MDNGLTANCHGFPTSGTLQLRNTCKVFTVTQNSTCTTISKANNITVAQLRSWNPVIAPACHNIARLVDTQLCVSSPDTPYSIPSASRTLAPTVVTGAASVPSNLANGTSQHCGRYYEVAKNDYCNLLVVKFGISLRDFRLLNSDINANCTNLYAGESYCVAAVGDIDTYSGLSESPRPTAKPMSSFMPFTELPLASHTTVESLTKPGKVPMQKELAKGTRTDCNFYFDGSAFVSNVSFYASQCELAAAVYGVDVDAFSSWNKAINASDPDCVFDPELRYCGKLYFGSDRDNALSDTEKSDPEVAISATDATAQNPLVTSMVSASRSSSSSTASVPRRGNETSDCSRWHTVHRDDSCASLAEEYSITLEEFYVWNPKVDKTCEFGFWFGYEYCVGTTNTATQARTTDATTH